VTETEAWLALNAAELRPRTVLDLLGHYGSPRAIVDAGAHQIAKATRLSPQEIVRFATAAKGDYEAQIEGMHRLGARLVTIRDSEYPTNLRQIYDPPPVLFVRGGFETCDENCVAIVGTRRVTPYGRMVSETLARDLAARGITVVSGLAVGADAAAHRGALSAGGRTIGVLACGIDVPYPRDTLDLRDQAAESGAVVSELPLGTPAKRHRFAARNRLVSGFSLGVVVTEAPERSGALITANIAGDQGRQVFAVPGSVNSEFSRGTHALLRDGARLVESVEDIIDDLDMPDMPLDAMGEGEVSTVDLTADELSILEGLSLQQRHVDDIIEGCRMPASQASAGLLMLEMKGLVRRLPGNMFMRVR